jgi:hypothetical protein
MSRPFEGLIVAMLVGIVVIVRSAQRRKFNGLFSRVLLGALLVLIPPVRGWGTTTTA